MQVTAADLTSPASARMTPGACGTTLNMVAAWLAEQRRGKEALEGEEESLGSSGTRTTFADNVWQCLSLLGSPSLWPLSLKALWLGEPVWDHLQREGAWFQVVEVVLSESRTGSVIGKAARPWRRVSSHESCLETLIQVPSEVKSGGLAYREGTDPNVTVVVGQKSRLAVRVMGYPPAELREALQALCFEADALLDEPMVTASNQQRLMQTLVQKALLRSGPRAAPWNIATAARSVVVLALLLLAVSGWALLQEERWQQALAQLDAEPGVKVTGSHLVWGSRVVEGFRDVQAADPAPLLRRYAGSLSAVELNLDTVIYQEAPSVATPPLHSTKP